MLHAAVHISDNEEQVAENQKLDERDDRNVPSPRMAHPLPF